MKRRPDERCLLGDPPQPGVGCAAGCSGVHLQLSDRVVKRPAVVGGELFLHLRHNGNRGTEFFLCDKCADTDGGDDGDERCTKSAEREPCDDRRTDAAARGCT
ncbi:hypothetical protein [Microbacterium sp.]|uniref:hypothetical protein n=1 Tax=Microbacterium sp. TaxID=51671 RepID=UPI0037C60713